MHVCLGVVMRVQGGFERELAWVRERGAFNRGADGAAPFILSNRALSLQ